MNPPGMICIGGPCRSSIRDEMLALKGAADTLAEQGLKKDVDYKVTSEKTGKKGWVTVYHLWRTPEGIAKAITKKQVGAGIVVHGMRGYHSGAFKSKNHRTP